MKIGGVIIAIIASDDAEGAIVETFHPINIGFGGCTTMGDAEFHPLPNGPEMPPLPIFYKPVRPVWPDEPPAYRPGWPFPQYPYSPSPFLSPNLGE